MGFPFGSYLLFLICLMNIWYVLDINRFIQERKLGCHKFSEKDCNMRINLLRIATTLERDCSVRTTGFDPVLLATAVSS